MPRTKLSLEEQLVQLELQRKQLENAHRALSAQVSAAREKQDTRRRILLGAFLLNQLERSGPSMIPIRQWMARELPAFLTKPRDKAALADILAALSDDETLPNSRAEISDTNRSLAGA